MCGCFTLAVSSRDGRGSHGSGTQLWEWHSFLSFLIICCCFPVSSLASPFLLYPLLLIFIVWSKSVLCISPLNFLLRVLVVFFSPRDFPNCSKIQEHSCSFNLLFKRALKDLILRPNISSQFSLLINLPLLNLLNALVQREKKQPTFGCGGSGPFCQCFELYLLTLSCFQFRGL